MIIWGWGAEASVVREEIAASAFNTPATVEGMLDGVLGFLTPKSRKCP